MRVAAGVILILAAVINLFAGLGYMAGGAFVGGAGKMGAAMGSAMEESAKKQGRELTEEEKKSLQQLNEAAGQAKAVNGVAGILLAYGLFLLVTAGTSIAGAVCLFRRRAVKFIVIASILAITAEVLSCVVVGAVAGAGVGLTKLMFSLVGIIGGTFGIIGARQISAANAMPAAPPAAMPM
ncbi:MAG TPA: hypothetical protein VN903_24655 [Polyangia bacterium]|jgi:hypothetical protein|nr:hypothetical protein [Polyangia bacterium]